MDLPARYPYNARLSVLVWTPLFFGVVTAYYLYQALYHQGPIEYFGFEMGPAVAKPFHWTFAFLCGAAVLAIALAAWRRYFHPKVLVLREDALVLPHGLFQLKEATLPYRDIRLLQESSVGSETFLYLYTAQRRYSLGASLLPSQEKYLEIYAFLRSRIAGTPVGGPPPGA